jgi:NADPH:quinone reductase-like Zn-dependent oxidoreductase
VKAAVSARYGPPDVVRVTEVAQPRPGQGEVLVAVRVATVNRTDCGLRAGHPFFSRAFTGLTRPRAAVLGGEFAGVVAEAGPAVTRFRRGQRVFGFAENRYGAHAEYLVMPEDGAIAEIPPEVSLDDAAASTEASHYALTNIRAAHLQPGSRVLVYGATGAIGSAAVQLLKREGAYVTAVCGTRYVDLVRGLEADRVIDYLTEDFTRDDQTYDVVFDAVGKTTYGRCRRLLTPRGRYLTTDLGPYAQNPVLQLGTVLGRGRRVILPIPRARDRAFVESVGRMMAAGEFRPLLDRRYPLDAIVEAYRYVDSEQKIGNVLIDLAEPM